MKEHVSGCFFLNTV